MSDESGQYIRRSRAAVLAVAVSVCAVPTLVSAQSFDGQIGLASEYVGKGLGKSAGDPAVSGSFEIGQSDFYGSVFVSTAKLSQGSDAEIISAIGYRPKLGAFAFDLSVINRDLPGTRPGIDSNYMEYQADASRKFGPVATRLRVNYSPDGFAATREAWWVELQAGVALDDKTKATVALADRSADGGAEYVAWNIGVKRKLSDALSADLRFYDTDGHSFGEAYEGRLVAALTYSF